MITFLTSFYTFSNDVIFLDLYVILVTVLIALASFCDSAAFLVLFQIYLNLINIMKNTYDEELPAFVARIEVLFLLVFGWDLDCPDWTCKSCLGKNNDTCNNNINHTSKNVNALL